MTSTQPWPYRTGQILGIDGRVFVVLIRRGESEEHITCAGEKLVGQRPPPCSAPAPRSIDGVRPGDLVWDPATGLELRCIRGGPGPLVHGGRTMLLLPLDTPVHAPTR